MTTHEFTATNTTEAQILEELKTVKGKLDRAQERANDAVQAATANDWWSVFDENAFTELATTRAQFQAVGRTAMLAGIPVETITRMAQTPAGEYIRITVA